MTYVTIDSCFDHIWSHQQRIPWSTPLEIEPATTVNLASLVYDVERWSVVEFRICILWSPVRSPVVEIMVYAADET